ncbi:MAG: TonB-dependent receptor [Flavobacteriales bacterium]|nr:TonB-dependent receptor [Flavobacteriales bacterium]
MYKTGFILVAAMMLFMESMSQSNVQGIVYDNSGTTALQDVQVIVDGQRRGTVTDKQGRFILPGVLDGDYVLLFGFPGYQELRKEVKVAGADITMEVYLIPEERDIDIIPLIPLHEAEIEGSAIRAQKNTPVAYKNIKAEDIEPLNNGQDMPYLLRFTPSLVSTSDAGAGVGYTGLRIRGSDASRINVTVNDIPLNDPESQNVYWVNLPDLGSNTRSIQIQRGVGTSSNGSGAFGGSVNIRTRSTSMDPYAEVSNSFGSFNTWKNSVAVGSGTINNWTVEGRVSRIVSDGYIDRAASNLFSYYTAASWYGGPVYIRALAFGGRERTYQSWYGTPESRLNNDDAAMMEHAANNGLTEAQTQNLLNSGRTYNYYQYENEVDDYAQDHLQLHMTVDLRSNLLLRLAGHYTYGRGFFEQYRQDDDFVDYGLLPFQVGNTVIESTDLVRRRWLQNDFYGGVGSLEWHNQSSRVVLGGSYNEYFGNHYGELTWMEYANGTQPNDLYYLNKASKQDLNVFLRGEIALTNKLTAFADLQYRSVNYVANGLDSDRRDILVDQPLAFFNPKAGLNYQLGKFSRIYASYAVGNREPVRNDYIDAVLDAPKPETMQDFEAGFQRVTKKLFAGLNLYAMEYNNQLVLTGELNDVGNPIRQNVDQSYRRGVEVELSYMPLSRLTLGGNFTWSMNKIVNFTSYLYDYTSGAELIATEHGETDIAFSPSIIGAAQAVYSVVNTDNHLLDIAWMVKYVGDQYLDNTSISDRQLDAYLVNDARITYTVRNCCLKEATVNLLINNVLNEMYSSNGYTYSYIYGKTITENFYYPQAGTNFLLNVTLKF